MILRSVIPIGYHIIPASTPWYKYELIFWDGDKSQFIGQYFDWYWVAKRRCKRYNKLFKERDIIN